MEKKQRQILHVDVNNAFLSWTALDRLNQGEKVDIREIEAVIGGDESKRSGIVLAKSMKAKRRGVYTGETFYKYLKEIIKAIKNIQMIYTKFC